MTYGIVIVSNTEFDDVLQIQISLMEKTIPSTIPVYILSNKDYMHPQFKTIVYDNSLPYTGRMLTCLQQIPEEYVIILRDSNIIIQYDDKYIQSLLHIMNQYSIDRINMYHIAHCEYPIKVNDTLSLHKHTDIRNYIFNVQPAIVRRTKLISVFEKHPNKSYLDAECEEIQIACRDSMSTYVIHDTECIQSMFHKTSKGFCFLTLTSAGKFLPIDTNMNPFVLQIQKTIFEEFIQKGTRPVHHKLPWV